MNTRSPFFCSLSASLVFLQPVLLAEQAPSAPPKEDEISAIDTLRADIHADHLATIRSLMQLNPDESVAFWPIYKEYSAEMSRANDDRIAAIRELLDRGYRPRVIPAGAAPEPVPDANLCGLIILAPSDRRGAGFLVDGLRLLRSSGPALERSGQCGGAALLTVSRLDGEFAVQGLDGMHEKCRRSRRTQRSRNLTGDNATFTHAGYDSTAAASVKEIDCAIESGCHGTCNAVRQCTQSLGLNAHHIFANTLHNLVVLQFVILHC